MEIKRGTAVSPGVAIGPALVLDTEWFRIPNRFAAVSSDEEIARLHRALDEAAELAQESQRAVAEKIGAQYGAVLGAHALMIRDPRLVAEFEALIRDHGHAAEYAVSRVMRRYAKALESINSGTFAARAADLFDIEKQILERLLGTRGEQIRQLSDPVVVLAHDLSPSETATLDRAKVHAFATETGGRASHTAIMAGALEIPAVVGLGRFLTDVSGGDTIIVDGNRGVLILNPDDETLERYTRLRTSFQSFESALDELKELPAETKDGTPVTLLGNIEFPTEAAHAAERGAQGIGLYRTEFLYLGKKVDPTEADHLEAYLTVIQAIGKGPVVIRTLDVGADKFKLEAEPTAAERNPFLGVRSVRLCLRNLTLFKTQMRAILRASAYGDVRIMFPMVSTLMELRQCKMILAEVKEDLEEEGIPFNRKLPVGTMIEVPSAALMSDQFAREVNFFSIGTNDLIQYTLAADRTNENVASLYSPGDPAVLRLIAIVIEAAKKQQIQVNVCGEMSGEPIYTILLLGMGLRQFSVTPHHIPEIKKIIRSVTIDECEQAAREVLGLETARDVNSYLKEQARRILPEMLD
jgi:phosphotransferase system enzyme I (PtsI)